jgi:phosphopantothenoylcysteine decarboxylase/phosphopantothenate--cysteine ligase
MIWKKCDLLGHFLFPWLLTTGYGLLLNSWWLNKMLKDKHILLGVTGGIAAYKVVELCRAMIREDAQVRVVMTKNAQEFVAPLTFHTLSGHRVATDMFQLWEEAGIGHIGLADWADCLVIAPGTANIIGKMAAGIADDMLSTIVLACTSPCILCPSMNVNMYESTEKGWSPCGGA